MKRSFLAKLAALVATTLLMGACGKRHEPVYQGYLEGEFVYLASPLAGQLDKLAVRKGAQVAAGAPLFTLEQGAELAALREAAERVRQTQARLADLQKGQRPTELAALEARLAQARAAAELANREFLRQNQLHQSQVASEDDFDRARLRLESANQTVAELAAQFDTAQLGARADVVAAATAEAAAAKAALDRAGWSVAQKSQSAPRAGLVYDTLYREGEFVGAGAPVISLLPPENLKVRFFVPESDLARLRLDTSVRVTLSGHDAPFEARVSYIATKPEYTPPVLYNRENRAKLVFMVEATLAPEIARDLHPGQPAEVARP